MSGNRFLRRLRRAGVQLHLEGERLFVEAPTGAITAEMRAELSRHKPELVSALLHESDSRALPGRNSVVDDSLREIASLLATAYRRYRAVRHVSDDQDSASGHWELANRLPRSVHGVVE